MGFQGSADRLGHGQVAEPLLVRGHHVPRGLLAGAAADGVLVDPGVLRPEVPLRPVLGVELPGLLRLLLPLQQAHLLLLGGDVQKELEHDGAVADQQPLEVVDLLEARPPDARWRQLVHPHHQHVLVVGAVEDGDPPPGRGVGVDAPEKVVVQLLGARHPEGGHVHAARVEPAHHALDCAVLARGVPSLEHQQQAMGAGREHQLLEVEQFLAQLLEAGLGLAPLHTVGRQGGDLGQIDPGVGVVELVRVHGATSWALWVAPPNLVGATYLNTGKKGV